jgi:hypothetical protein
MRNSSNRSSYLAWAAALLFVAVPARAELTWKSVQVDLEATLEDKELKAQFPFKNEGTETVTFKEIKSTCGCVSMTVSNQVVPPGASGEVNVVFRPEYRVGVQKRPIMVEFDDAGHSRKALYLAVHLPEVLRAEPIALKWERNEKLEPKTATIVTDEKFPVKSLRVLPGLEPGSQPVATEVTRVENSRNFSVEISPLKRGTDALTLSLEATLEDGKVKRTDMFVIVR